MKIRTPAVAGSFYPADPEALRRLLRSYLEEVEVPPEGPPPKALIVPHAGYLYSGPVAASAYARLAPFRDQVTRVVVLGPSHFATFPGLAVPPAEIEAFATPLGTIPLDRPALENLLRSGPAVTVRPEAHAQEHSLEVQLPFLQETLATFTLVPIVAGKSSPGEIAGILDQLWDGPGSLFVVSSDLSHYHAYPTAQERDRRTAEHIVALEAGDLSPGDACGCGPIQGLLNLARQHHLNAELLDLRNSGDTAGPRDQVVGYAALAFR